jgi:hemerythrin-like metal-binding protein
MRLRWQETMNLGVAEIDAAHRHLFQLLDTVAVAVDARMMEAAQISVSEFLEAALQHLASEEGMFDRVVEFHDSSRHINTHNEARRTFKRLHSAICDNADLSEARTILDGLIPDMIIRLHQEDTALASALKN